MDGNFKFVDFVAVILCEIICLLFDLFPWYAGPRGDLKNVIRSSERQTVRIDLQCCEKNEIELPWPELCFCQRRLAVIQQFRGSYHKKCFQKH